jgi:5-methylcytosine-specific restriction endonuclease McrA
MKIYALLLFLYLAYTAIKMLEQYIYYPHTLVRKFVKNENSSYFLAVTLISPYVILICFLCFEAVASGNIGIANWLLIFHIAFAFVILWAKDKQEEKARTVREAEERRLNAIKAREIYNRYLKEPTLINDKQFRDEFRQHWRWHIIRDVAINKWKRESNGACNGCGKILDPDFDEIHVDHIKPKSVHRHLYYYLPNLQILCRSCNIDKSDYDGDDWKEFVRQKRSVRKEINHEKIKRHHGKKLAEIVASSNKISRNQFLLKKF